MEKNNFSNISITKNYNLTEKEESEYISQINQLLASFERQITFSLFASSVISGRTITELMLKLLLRKEGYDISKKKFTFYQLINFSYQQKIIPKQCKDFLQIIRENGNLFVHDDEMPNELIFSFLKAFSYFLQWFNNNYSKKYQKILKIDACHKLIDAIEYDKTDDTLKIIKKQKNHEIKNSFATRPSRYGENKENLSDEYNFKKIPKNNKPLAKKSEYHESKGKSNEQSKFSKNGKSAKNRKKDYADPSQDNSNHENINEGAILNELRHQNESIKQILETVLETNKITKNIDEKINAIAKRLDSIQSYTERLIESAWTEEEIDRIIQSHTNECVESIFEHERDILDEDEYGNINKALIETFGDRSWEKLSENSKTFLITSKFMFNKLITLDEAIDYSGICILVTKALEVEIYKRFFTDFIGYLDENYNRNYSEYPTALLFKNARPLHAEKFTMGNIAFVLCLKKDRYDTDEQKENNKVKLMEYCKSNVFSKYDNGEIEELLSRYATSIEDIRIKYRNPSAHRNQIECIDAKECIDLIIDVEKLLKKMLDSFDY